MARGLGETHRSWHDRPVDELTQVASGFGRDVRGQVGPCVVHGQDDAVDLETRIEVLTNEIECS